MRDENWRDYVHIPRTYTTGVRTCRVRLFFLDIIIYVYVCMSVRICTCVYLYMCVCVCEYQRVNQSELKNELKRKEMKL